MALDPEGFANLLSSSRRKEAVDREQEAAGAGAADSPDVLSAVPGTVNSAAKQGLEPLQQPHVFLTNRCSCRVVQLDPSLALVDPRSPRDVQRPWVLGRFEPGLHVSEMTRLGAWFSTKGDPVALVRAKLFRIPTRDWERVGAALPSAGVYVQRRDCGISLPGWHTMSLSWRATRH